MTLSDITDLLHQATETPDGNIVVQHCEEALRCIVQFEKEPPTSVGQDAILSIYIQVFRIIANLSHDVEVISSVIVKKGIEILQGYRFVSTDFWNSYMELKRLVLLSLIKLKAWDVLLQELQHNSHDSYLMLSRDYQLWVVLLDSLYKLTPQNDSAQLNQLELGLLRRMLWRNTCCKIRRSREFRNRFMDLVTVVLSKNELLEDRQENIALSKFFENIFAEQQCAIPRHVAAFLAGVTDEEGVNLTSVIRNCLRGWWISLSRNCDVSKTTSYETLKRLLFSSNALVTYMVTFQLEWLLSTKTSTPEQFFQTNVSYPLPTSITSILKPRYAVLLQLATFPDVIGNGMRVLRTGKPLPEELGNCLEWISASHSQMCHALSSNHCRLHLLHDIHAVVELSKWHMFTGNWRAWLKSWFPSLPMFSGNENLSVFDIELFLISFIVSEYAHCLTLVDGITDLNQLLFFQRMGENDDKKTIEYFFWDYLVGHYSAVASSKTKYADAVDDGLFSRLLKTWKQPERPSLFWLRRVVGLLYKVRTDSYGEDRSIEISIIGRSVNTKLSLHSTNNDEPSLFDSLNDLIDTQELLTIDFFESAFQQGNEFAQVTGFFSNEDDYSRFDADNMTEEILEGATEFIENDFSMMSDATKAFQEYPPVPFLSENAAALKLTGETDNVNFAKRFGNVSSLMNTPNSRRASRWGFTSPISVNSRRQSKIKATPSHVAVAAPGHDDENSLRNGNDNDTILIESISLPANMNRLGRQMETLKMLHQEGDDSELVAKGYADNVLSALRICSPYSIVNQCEEICDTQTQGVDPELCYSDLASESFAEKSYSKFMTDANESSFITALYDDNRSNLKETGRNNSAKNFVIPRTELKETRLSRQLRLLNNLRS